MNYTGDERRGEASLEATLELIRLRVHDQANEMSKLVLQMGLIGKDIAVAVQANGDHEARLRRLEDLSPAGAIAANVREHQEFRHSIEETNGAIKELRDGFQKAKGAFWAIAVLWTVVTTALPFIVRALQ